MATEMNNIDMEALLCGDNNRLRYVSRFSTCHVVHHESVAEHSFYVTFYAMAIADWCNIRAVKDDPDRKRPFVNIEAVLRQAVLHDLEEARTGDIYRPFKKASAELDGAIEQQASLELARIIDPLLDDDEFRRMWGFAWQLAKDDSKAGRIVAFADFLSAVGYMLQEIRVSNSTMLEHTNSIRSYADRFNEKDFDFIRPLVDQVQEMVKEAFPDERRERSSSYGD